MAELLRQTGRRGDVLARYGGEEFVALLYGATASDGWRFAEAFRSAVAAQGFPGESTQPLGRITVSGGVATFPLDAQDDIALIKAADARLYRAKDSGRNCTDRAGGRGEGAARSWPRRSCASRTRRSLGGGRDPGRRDRPRDRAGHARAATPPPLRPGSSC